MDEARQHLLAGTGGPVHEHGHICRRDAPGEAKQIAACGIAAGDGAWIGK